MPSLVLDGSWIDFVTFVVAVIFTAFKFFRIRNTQKKFFSKATGYDLMTGTSIFPLVLLGGSAFSSNILQMLLGSNKLLMSVAGLFALLALLEDEFEKEEDLPVKKQTRRQQRQAKQSA